MPWRPLPRIAFGICVYPFQPSSTADLPLEIGDELYIIEQGGIDGAWYRGYLVAPPSLLAGLTSVKGQTLEARVFSGIFPRCCVEVREVLGDDRVGRGNGDTVEHLEEPIGRGGAQEYNDDRRRTGAVTPTDSATMTPSADSVTDQKTLHVTKTDSRPESGMPGPKSVSRLSRLDTKRTTSHGSWRANRSEQTPYPMLPLSPVSTIPPDPNAPKPLAPVPMLKIGDETPTSAQEPLVDEIASCLREWHSTKLHELLLSRRYSSLDKMWALVQRLDTARRQLLHKVLTAQELRGLRESTVWDLVAGNKMLSGEIIVRSPSQRGRILTADDSAIELTRLQTMMSLLDEKPTPHQDEHMLHHVMVDIKSFNGEPNQPTTIAMYLCIKDTDMTMRPVSEVYAVDLSTRDVTATSAMDGNMRTLFVDLSAPDIGEGAGSGSTLYLVFKVLTNESLRSRNAGDAGEPASGEIRSRTNTLVKSPNQDSVKGGRRSRMWGSKGRKSSDVTVKSVESRPITKESTQSIEAQRQPNSSNPQTPPSRDQKTVKRTVGAGVMEINSLMSSSSEVEQEVVLWTPVLPLDEYLEHEDAWEDFIGELIPSSTGTYKKLDSLNRLVLHVKAFAHPDAESLIRKTPTLLHDISQTRKIGFSGAPTKPRSDIYLTLSEPFLPRNALLSHPKTGTVPLTQTNGLANLQLTLEVRRSSGERIENCIYPSCNSAGHTAWRTTAVERGEAWNLTIRLAISPEDVPGAHIVMSIADAPDFPFALCWMPLWSQDAFVRDGDHSLALYKYDEYTSSVISGRGAYLALPWTAPKKDASTSGPLAALHLRTYLCSTQHSQDPILLGLLRWQDQGGANLTQLLKRFTFVPEIEIVKLLNQVFDALFEILVEYAGGEEYEDLVFSALVIALGIVHDRRFNVAPLVDQYAETCFRYPLATSCLLRSFTRLLANPEDPDSSRKLRATFKVGAHIFKFIIHARQLEKEKEAGVGITSRQSAFVGDVQKIFGSLEALMKNQAPILIGTKTILVQNFHTWLSELSSCMSPLEVAQIATNFVDACEHVQGKLILYKLILIINSAHLDVLNLPDTRELMFSNTPRWLDPYWGKATMVTEQWKEQVRLCCSVVASQVNHLGQHTPHYISKLVDSYRAIQASSREPKRTLSLPFPTSYPFPTKPTSVEALFDEALLEISAVLAAITSVSTGLDLKMQQAELSDFLFNVLQVYISVLDGEAFPNTWLSIHIYHHRSTMRALEKLSSILIASCLPHPDDADQFNTELWRAFFDALLKLIGSDALALEVFPEQKRRAVWKIAGDVRELGADLLRRTWKAIGWDTNQDDRLRYGLTKMGGYQVQYVPGLVCPIVELCLSVHEGLRGVAIEVLQTMIVSEWTLSQDLALIQAEIIDCLDRLFKTKNVTEAMLQKMFLSELIDLFEPLKQDPDDGLSAAVKNLIAVIDELLDLLVAVHSTETSGEIFHIMDTLHLMEFLKDMHKEDIYIRYVHQLAQLQNEARNYTEAGLALRLHADLYDWDPTSTVDALRDPEFPSQTCFERKEALYFQMIKHYEDGLSWDNALGSYMELATQYEHNVFDFSKLARTQRAMATIYDSISQGERQNPRYFRVVYKGLGFPVGIRDKQFIFEGPPTDRLATFTDHMQQQHPSAQIMTASGEEDLEGQYLHIYPVSPQRNLLHPIYQRSKVSQPIREHYLLSRPNSFTTTSRRQRSDVGAKELVVQKTVYTTAEAFPTILRRSEIVAVNTVTLSPIETAIERTTRKTTELIAIEKRVADGDVTAFASLTEALMLSVESASDASVSRHRELLPQRRPSLAGEELEEERPQFDPLENALQVALVDHALAVKRCLGLYTRPAQQATRADLTQRFETTYAPELESLAPATRVSRLDSPTASWLAASISPTIAPQARPQSPQDAASQTSADVSHEKRPSRHEKSRLSLAFLKRGSMMDQRGSHKSNGSLDNVAEKKRDESEGRSKERGRNRLSFLYSPASEDPSRQNSGSLRPNSSVSETPETGMSEQSGGQGLLDRGGSVKKRLGLLSIGKKASNYSVRSRVEGSVAEEG